MAKNTFIKVRVTEEDRQRYLDASRASETDISTVIRAALDRFAKRAEKTAGGQQ